MTFRRFCLKDMPQTPYFERPSVLDIIFSCVHLHKFLRQKGHLKAVFLVPIKEAKETH